MDIDKLKSAMDKHSGAAVNNRFNVIFTPPTQSLFNLDISSIISASLGSGFDPKNLINDPRDISLLCQSVNIPGRSLSTFNYAAEGTEQQNAYPYEIIDDDCSMKFLLTNDMYMRKMFDNWMKSIYDIEKHKFSFKDDYSVDVTLQMLDKENNAIYGVKLQKAYPVKISGIDLTQGKDELVEFQVDWKYDKYKELGIVGSTLSKASSFLDLIT